MKDLQTCLVLAVPWVVERLTKEAKVLDSMKAMLSGRMSTI